MDHNADDLRTREDNADDLGSPELVLWRMIWQPWIVGLNTVRRNLVCPWHDIIGKTMLNKVHHQTRKMLTVTFKYFTYTKINLHLKTESLNIHIIITVHNSLWNVATTMTHCQPSQSDAHQQAVCGPKFSRQRPNSSVQVQGFLVQPTSSFHFWRAEYHNLNTRFDTRIKPISVSYKQWTCIFA